jgi:uncharacterized protein DUF87
MTLAIEMGQLGPTPDSAPALLDLEELLSTRLLVQGNSGSGKSHLLRRLLEQSASWVQQAVIDPEGDFVTLAERFNHLVIDASAHDEAALQAAGERMRAHRISVVLDLEGLHADAQMRQAAAFLGGMFDAPRAHWYPTLVVVDEAQLFAPAAAGEVSDEARRTSLGAMTNLMCRGRKRGLAGVVATQRLAKLAKNVAAEASNFLMGRTFLDIDMARAADLLGMERRQAEAFRDLPRGQFLALGPALSRRPVHIRIGAVETESRAAGPVLLPLPQEPQSDPQALVLSPLPERAGVARPVRRVAPPPVDILAQLAAHQPPSSAAPEKMGPEEAPDPVLLGERRRRLRAVADAMMDDPEACFRPVPVLYQDFLVRCRIAALGRDVLDLRGFRQLLALARSGIDAVAADGEDWREAERIAWSLPEDVQGVFLLVARIARDGLPCPGDAMIARAYGTHSLSRARRQLLYLEEQEVIVLRADAAGRRIAVVIGLGWETAPGDPAAVALTA